MTARACVTPLALPFQNELDRLIDEPTTRLLRLWPALGFGVLAALVTAAAFLPIDVVITANGRLAADAPAMLLRPNVRAVLQELLVGPGDVVQAGQVLARFDATLPLADRTALLAEQQSLRAEIARNLAEISGASLAPTSADLEQQSAILTQRRALNATRIAALDAVVLALEGQTLTLAAMTPALSERLTIARAIEEMQQELADRQSAPRIDALTARAARLGVDSELSALRARQSELARALRAAKDERAVFIADLPREASEALPRLRLRLSQINDALDKAERVISLTELVAPRAGVVVSVAPGGVGAILSDAEPLVVLVASDAALLADISIASTDLGRIAAGDLVAIKVDAFPHRRFGLAQGRIASLGPVSFTPEDSATALHPVRVTLLAPPPDLPPGMVLLPGMTLSAEVKTGTRTLLDYFLDPLERGLSESLREP